MSVPNGLRRHAVPRPADATSITHRVTPSHLAAVGEGPLLTKSTLNAPVPLRRPIDAEGIGTVPLQRMPVSRGASTAMPKVSDCGPSSVGGCARPAADRLGDCASEAEGGVWRSKGGTAEQPQHTLD